MGVNGLEEYIGQYSPDGLQSAIAQAGLVTEMLNQQAPRYMTVPEGGYLVNTRDPDAVRQAGTPRAASTLDDLPPPPPGFQIEGGPTQAASGGFPGR